MFHGLPLILEYLPLKKATWKLTKPLEYEAKSFKCVVPTGWVTDLTSKPELFFWIKKEAEHTPASIVHDWCYAKGYVLSKSLQIKVPISRRRADLIYLQGMKELKVPMLRYWQIYLGVRLGGWRPWRRYRKRKG